MRILYATDNSHLRSTTAMLNAVVRELSSRGVEPVMLFREAGPWQESLASEGIPCHFDSLAWPDRRHPLRSFLHLARLRSLVKRERIELIHANEHNTYPLLRVVARWARIPIITTVRFQLNAGFGQWAFRPPYIPACLQFTSRAAYDVSRGALPEGLGTDRVAFIMNGLDVTGFRSQLGDRNALRAQWGANESTCVFGTASAIRPWKQIEDFVVLIDRMRRRSANVLGVVAGGPPFADTDYLVELRGMIREKGLEDVCLLLGNLAPIAPFMAAIDVMVTTSKWESFGMSVCEAMAAGTPVIGYDGGAVREVVHAPWCLVPVGDLDGLADRAGILLQDEARRRQLGAEAQRHVRRHFDAPVLAKRQLAVYDRILGGGVREIVNLDETPPDRLVIPSGEDNP